MVVLMAIQYRAVVQTGDDEFWAIESSDGSIFIYMRGVSGPVEVLPPSDLPSAHSAPEKLMAELIWYVYEMHRGYEITKATFTRIGA